MMHNAPIVPRIHRIYRVSIIYSPPRIPIHRSLTVNGEPIPGKVGLWLAGLRKK